MKLKFKDQAFQLDATNAVCDVFEGQPYHDPTSYTVEPGQSDSSGNDNLPMISVGFQNAALMLPPEALTKNLHAVQQRQLLPQSTPSSVVELDVEMETGTGKTFVYTKTIFELNKRYGWSKFIIITPGIAIREGVKKSLEVTAEKFLSDYGKTAKVYVYNSSRPQDIMDFSTSPDIQIMIINVQAFAAEDRANRGESRRIYMKLDAFGSRRPIDLIKANRPILILDEPQKMEGATTQKKLQEFNALFLLRYSATHRTLHNLVYRLDAIDAFEQKLVKKIEPVCIEAVHRSGTHPYLYCASILPGAHEAETVLEFQKKRRDGEVVTHQRTVRQGEDLHALSGLQAYADRYRITEINAKEGYAVLRFENGLELRPGQVVSDMTDDALRRIQIREAIRAHLEKESLLYCQGIKVLTLFFIDEVSKYRVYKDSDTGEAGAYARLFEEEYDNVLQAFLNERSAELDPKLKAYWEGLTAKITHSGYFAQDRHHRIKNTSGESADDITAYDLILKEKERLLSLTEPVRFIFSHSALREGWDNPNVFVICPLKQPEVGNTAARRQELGRGLRLCVNQEGERQDDPMTVHRTNLLTVIATESYASYVGALQHEVLDACKHRPQRADVQFLTHMVVTRHEGGTTQKYTLSEHEAKLLNKWLFRNDFIDEEDLLQTAWHQAYKDHSLPELPEKLLSLTPYRDDLFAKINSVVKPIDFSTPKDRPQPLRTNDNFTKEAFTELWKRISRKSTYTVHFNSEELIRKSIEALNKQLFVPKVMVLVKKGIQTTGDSFGDTTQHTEEISAYYVDSELKFDLVGAVAEGTTLTRKTIQAILSGIHPEKFAQFKHNPEKFIAECIRIITEQKGTTFIESVQYHPMEAHFDTALFTANQTILPKQKAPVRTDGKVLQKHIYDYLVSDSKVERAFAAQVDTDEKVIVFSKLPSSFKIATPVGSYNPDWALVYQSNQMHHLFFVAETKGALSEMNVTPLEQAKIDYATKHFAALAAANECYHVTYKKVAKYQDLLDLVQMSDDSSEVTGKC